MNRLLDGHAIVVDGLIKRYGRVVAVDGVSFRVGYGEVFGFLGPNGAGKTTTIHVLATLLRPDGGRVLVAGRDVVRDPVGVRRSIGVVFQDPSLDGELSGFENLYLHGRIYGLRGSVLHERIGEMLRFVELWEYRNRLVKYYSGGMRRRLEIARALLHRPRILFLDEPTLGLDPQTRAHIWDYIRKLRREMGVTVFLTTHYMEEAEALCDRIAIIDHGKIIAEGTPDELKRMAGNDIVYLKIRGVGPGICDIFEDIVMECRELQGSRIALKVEDAVKALPRLLVRARDKGLDVLEASYHRPSLNDVFLLLTGREIREEAPMDMIKAVAMSRRWRR